jgi:hypothetical protein
MKTHGEMIPTLLHKLRERSGVNVEFNVTPKRQQLSQVPETIWKLRLGKPKFMHLLEEITRIVAPQPESVFNSACVLPEQFQPGFVRLIGQLLVLAGALLAVLFHVIRQR